MLRHVFYSYTFKRDRGGGEGGIFLGQRTWWPPTHSPLDEWDPPSPPPPPFLASSQGTRAPGSEAVNWCSHWLRAEVCVCALKRADNDKRVENSKLDWEPHEWTEGERNRTDEEEQRQRDREWTSDRAADAQSAIYLVKHWMWLVVL